MADRFFVIYLSTIAGTPQPSTARPAITWYVEEDTHVPDLTGYTIASPVTTPGYVSFPVAPTAGYFDVPMSSDPLQRVNVTIDPAGPTYAVSYSTRATLEQRQRMRWGEIEEKIEEYAWTQRMDAKLTVAQRALCSTYITALGAMTTHASWATNPEAVAYPTEPVAVTRAAATALTDQGEVIERSTPGKNYLDNGDFTELDDTGLPDGLVFTNSLTIGTQTETTRQEVIQGLPYLRMEQVGTATDGYKQGYFNQVGLLGTITTTLGRRVMPVKAGETWVEVSGRCKTVSSLCNVTLQFLDDAGAAVGSAINVRGSWNPGGSGDNPANWPQIFNGVCYLAPAGATFASVYVRKTAPVGGVSPSSVNLALLYLGVGHERQTQPTPWVDGVRRFPGSDRLRVNAVRRLSILNGAVTDTISDDAGSTIYPNVTTTQTRLSITLPEVIRGEFWYVIVSFRARNRTNAVPTFRFQRNYLDPDTGLLVGWADVYVVDSTDMTTSYNTYAQHYFAMFPTANFYFRLTQAGTGTNVTEGLFYNLNITAKRVTK